MGWLLHVATDKKKLKLLIRRWWYASMVVSFVNGVEQPTIESAEANFGQLGVDFRGYHDFGFDQAEYLSGVKVKGIRTA
ncbi:MAG: hypothetical protein GY758_13825 [Fuerstiella sp.]|nr:hypothetical protein [Fuerstiella sp.]MCP4510363.1 hypothetical protein [Fuerstiella sp.]